MTQKRIQQLEESLERHRDCLTDLLIKVEELKPYIAAMALVYPHNASLKHAESIAVSMRTRIVNTLTLEKVNASASPRVP